MENSYLITKKPFKAILIFSIPMILSVTLQQLYNICDSMIAGRYISGDDALAAVNASYPITMVYLAIATGFAIGCNIICASYVGMQKNKEVRECVNTSLITIAITAIIIGLLGYLLTNPILRLLGVGGEEYFKDASIYLKYYTLGMLFLFIYNAVTSLFQSMGVSKIPLYLLAFSTLLNIILDYCFVRYLNMGVKGIALATFIAQGVASTLAFIILIIYIKKYFKASDIKIYNTLIIKKILPISIPSIIQASIISLGQVAIQGIVNGFSAAAVAGYGSAYKLCYVIVNIYTTMSNAISTYVSQNIGAKKYDRLKKGYYAGLLICIILTIITTIIFVSFPRPLLKIFANKDTSNAMFRVGKQFIYCVAPFYIILCLKIPCDGVLKGSKDMKHFMIATLADLVVRVAISYMLYKPMGIIGIFISWPIGWAIGMIISEGCYIKGTWKKKIGYDEIIEEENKQVTV